MHSKRLSYADKTDSLINILTDDGVKIQDQKIVYSQKPFSIRSQTSP